MNPIFKIDPKLCTLYCLQVYHYFENEFDSLINTYFNGRFEGNQFCKLHFEFPLPKISHCCAATLFISAQANPRCQQIQVFLKSQVIMISFSMFYSTFKLHTHMLTDCSKVEVWGQKKSVVCGSVLYMIKVCEG
jgi:hypothetical protein